MATPTPNNGTNGMPRNGVPAGPWAKFYSNEKPTVVDTGALHRGPGTPRPQDGTPSTPTGWPSAGDLDGDGD